VDIDPDTLNLKSEGQPVTAYIELPTGYDVGNIDVSTVRLCVGQVGVCPEEASIHAEEHPTGVGDHDGDTISDLMVKFDRQELIQLLGEQRGETLLTISGRVDPPGESSAGSDTIRVIDPGSGGEPAEIPAGDKTPQAPPAAAVPTFEYQVQPGDTLFDIALRFGTSVEALAEVNGLESAQVVWAGQVLKVPATAPPAPPSPPSPPAPPIATVEYTLRPGESVWDVAAFFGTTVETIAALNGLADANLVVAGQRLLVPEPAAGAGAAPPVFTSEYVVQPGETLTDIAARFGTTVEALAAANRLVNPSVIHHGDRLLVP